MQIHVILPSENKLNNRIQSKGKTQFKWESTCPVSRLAFPKDYTGNGLPGDMDIQKTFQAEWRELAISNSGKGAARILFSKIRLYSSRQVRNLFVWSLTCDALLLNGQEFDHCKLQVLGFRIHIIIPCSTFNLNLNIWKNIKTFLTRVMSIIIKENFRIHSIMWINTW